MARVGMAVGTGMEVPMLMLAVSSKARKVLEDGGKCVEQSTGTSKSPGKRETGRRTTTLKVKSKKTRN